MLVSCQHPHPFLLCRSGITVSYGWRPLLKLPKHCWNTQRHRRKSEVKSGPGTLLHLSIIGAAQRLLARMAADLSLLLVVVGRLGHPRPLCEVVQAVGPPAAPHVIRPPGVACGYSSPADPCTFSSVAVGCPSGHARHGVTGTSVVWAGMCRDLHIRGSVRRDLQESDWGSCCRMLSLTTILPAGSLIAGFTGIVSS